MFSAWKSYKLERCRAQRTSPDTFCEDVPPANSATLVVLALAAAGGSAAWQFGLVLAAFLVLLLGLPTLWLVFRLLGPSFLWLEDTTLHKVKLREQVSVDAAQIVRVARSLNGQGLLLGCSNGDQLEILDVEEGSHGLRMGLGEALLEGGHPALRVAASASPYLYKQ